MLSQWLLIMDYVVPKVVTYGEPVVVNHGVLCFANAVELRCAMLEQWL
jgi:hypothetical protein